jgi:hypothetical protein
VALEPKPEQKLKLELLQERELVAMVPLAKPAPSSALPSMQVSARAQESVKVSGMTVRPTEIL